MIVIDPRYCTVEYWSAQTGALLVGLGEFPPTTDEAGWQQWGKTLLGLPRLAALQIPNPDGFESWEEWGFRLNERLALLP